MPMNLFPSHQKDANISWGNATYQFYHLFDDSIHKDYYTSDIEVLQWTRCANRLQVKLKEIGLNAATAEIIRLCKDEYNMKGTDGQHPTNLMDVIAIVKTSSWYNNNLQRPRKIVHRFSYGIFRNGHNRWAYKHVSPWMSQYRIAYDNTTKHQRAGKGFVYSLLVSRASNTMGNTFREAMKSAYSEYIVVRSILSSVDRYVPITCGGFNAFLVSLPRSIPQSINDRLYDAVTGAHLAHLDRDEIIDIANKIYIRRNYLCETAQHHVCFPISILHCIHLYATHNYHSTYIAHSFHTHTYSSHTRTTWQ